MKVKDENIYKIFTNSIIFKMFQSLRFKNLLALNYVANYNFITEDFGEMNSYSHLGVQILTIPEVALNILQNVELRTKFWNMLCSATKISRDSQSDVNRREFFSLISDWKYMIKKEVLPYLYETGVVTDLINHFAELCMKDSVDQRINHIIFSSEGYFFQGLDYNYLTLKFGVTIIKDIDYSDVDFNRKVAKIFYAKINQFKDWWEENEQQKGFIEIPLFKIFSFWLSRYLMNNLVIQCKDLNDSKECFRIMRIILTDVF